jgi:hypothetical protein
VSTLHLIDASLVGLFGFAAVHYSIHWWFSRHERVVLVFAVLCALFMGFALANVSRHRATTIHSTQLALDWAMTLAILGHAAIVQLFAYLGHRRDRAFRAIVIGVFGFLAIFNLWSPLRGTVIELHRIQLLGGGTGFLPIRTPAGPSLALQYLTTLAVELYGLLVAHTIWKRDRPGGVLVAIGTLSMLAAHANAVLVDFAHLRAPYVGGSPIAFFVLCMALFRAREFAASARREAVANRHFEIAFEHAPIGMALLSADGRCSGSTGRCAASLARPQTCSARSGSGTSCTTTKGPPNSRPGCSPAISGAASSDLSFARMASPRGRSSRRLEFRTKRVGRPASSRRCRMSANCGRIA